MHRWQLMETVVAYSKIVHSMCPNVDSNTWQHTVLFSLLIHSSAASHEIPLEKGIWRLVKRDNKHLLGRFSDMQEYLIMGTMLMVLIGKYHGLQWCSRLDNFCSSELSFKPSQQGREIILFMPEMLCFILAALYHPVKQDPESCRMKLEHAGLAKRRSTLAKWELFIVIFPPPLGNQH